MADVLRTAVQKLNSINYTTWSYKVKLMLMKDKLWDVVRDAAPTPVDAAWTSKDGAAQAIIGLLVEDSQLRLINKATTAREQWNILKEYHQKSSLSGRIHLQMRLYHTVLPEGGDMVEHIATLFEYVDTLFGMNYLIDDRTFIGNLLCSIPESYDSFMMALEGRPETDLTLDFVKGKLIDAYMRCRNSQESRNSTLDETAMKTVDSDKRKVNSEANSRKFFLLQEEGAHEDGM